MSPSACRSASSVAALRLMTHLARAEEEDGVHEQLRGVRACVQGVCRIRARSRTPPASIRFDEVGGDYVRPGIMLYGSSPFPYDTADDARA